MVRDDLAQVDYVARSVLANREAGLALRDQAVLFRTASHSAALELELAPAQHSLRQVWRPALLRGGARQGPAGRPALGREPARPGRGIPGAAAAARHRPRHRAAKLDASAGGRRGDLAGQQPPAAAAELWPGSRSCWRSWRAPHGRCSSGLVRGFYDPLLAELYDFTASRRPISTSSSGWPATVPSRERFLTDLTLDPPAAERRHRPGRRTRTRTI